MEGLIPYVYKAIVQLKGGEAPEIARNASWFRESPSGPYIRLPGDSGRFLGSTLNRNLLSSPPASPIISRQSSLRVSSPLIRA